MLKQYVKLCLLEILCLKIFLYYHTANIYQFGQGWRNDSKGGGGGTRPWGPSRKRVPKGLKGPKTSYTTIAIAEKRSKWSKKGPFRYIFGPPGPTQELELIRPGGEGPSRSPPPIPPPPVSPAMHFVSLEPKYVGSYTLNFLSKYEM